MAQKIYINDIGEDYKEVLGDINPLRSSLWYS